MYYIYHCVPYPGSFLLQSVISRNDDDDENKIKPRSQMTDLVIKLFTKSLWYLSKEEMNEMCY